MVTIEGKIAVNLLGEQIEFAHTVLEGTIADVTTKIALSQPIGLARSIGSYYAHVLIVEDLAVNAMLRKQKPLFALEWKDRTGFDGPAPADPGQWIAWSSKARSDVVSSREYARSVFAETTAYMGSIMDVDLSNPLDLSSIGFGQQTVGWLISVFVVANCNWHTGEISCLKGGHGLKGYPF
jgi:hypothetical protein